MPRRPVLFWRLIRRSFISAYEDNCFGIAKGAAYSALLAFFPVLASIAAVLVQVDAEAVSRIISQFLFQVVPPGSEALVQYEFTVKGQRPITLLVLAIVLSLWAASGVLISLMEGFQAAYRLPSGRPFLRQRLVAILMVFTLQIPVLGASSLILFGSRVRPRLFAWMGMPMEEMRPWLEIIRIVLGYLIAVLTTVLVTGLLYYFGPNCRIKFRRVWPGAILATFLWALATAGFAWYVRNIANYNVMYGSIGAVIAMLIWMYLLAVITLLGCEYNAERERQLG